eukprot:GEMP01148405.1.p1 GENE.GEMP01148405.1~~GEMP01148405.1.p1  ORF type:complete len:123 (-),score=13.31 GEMP01148405.1:50-382(-)
MEREREIKLQQQRQSKPPPHSSFIPPRWKNEWTYNLTLSFYFALSSQGRNHSGGDKLPTPTKGSDCHQERDLFFGVDKKERPPPSHFAIYYYACACAWKTKKNKERERER